MRISDWSSDVCSSDLVVAPAALDSGDLCERIGAIGALQRPGEEIFLLDWLGRQLRIVAARSTQHQALNARYPSIVNYVSLVDQTVANEIGRTNSVVVNDADACGAHANILRPLLENKVRRPN